MPPNYIIFLKYCWEALFPITVFPGEEFYSLEKNELDSNASLFFFFGVGNQARSSWIQGTYPIPELYPQPGIGTFLMFGTTLLTVSSM